MIKAKNTLTGTVSGKGLLIGTLNTAYKTKDIYPELDNLVIDPTKDQQIFTHEDSYGYDEVTVNPIPEEYIIPHGTKEIVSNGEHDIKEYEKVHISFTPNLQSKSIEITKNGTQSISADDDYDGLDNVQVNIQVSGGITPVEPMTSINELPTFISNSVEEQLNQIPNTYPTYTDDALTLYTPSANATHYVIRKRGENTYGIIWFTCSVISIVSNYIRPTKTTISSFVIADTVSAPTLSNAIQKMLGYMSPNYTTFEECLNAIQNPNTTYTESTSLDWTNANDGEYDISATNMISSSGYGNLRKLSSNEVIKIIS